MGRGMYVCMYTFVCREVRGDNYPNGWTGLKLQSGGRGDK